MSDRIQAVNEYLRGWTGYFALAETPSVVEELDEWIRRRLRLCVWRQWRRVRTRYRELRRLGVPERHVHVLANTRSGPWRIAGGALNRFFNAAFWQQHGLESVKERYHQLRTAW
jgi:RNA-directed DNA polymerase